MDYSSPQHHITACEQTSSCMPKPKYPVLCASSAACCLACPCLASSVRKSPSPRQRKAMEVCLRLDGSGAREACPSGSTISNRQPHPFGDAHRTALHVPLPSGRGRATRILWTRPGNMTVSMVLLLRRTFGHRPALPRAGAIFRWPPSAQAWAMGSLGSARRIPPDPSMWAQY